VGEKGIREYRWGKEKKKGKFWVVAATFTTSPAEKERGGGERGCKI